MVGLSGLLQWAMRSSRSNSDRDSVVATRHRFADARYEVEIVVRKCSSPSRASQTATKRSLESVIFKQPSAAGSDAQDVGFGQLKLFFGETEISDVGVAASVGREFATTIARLRAQPCKSPEMSAE